MDYGAYKQARDKAWDILIKCEISELPVDMKRLCRQLGVPCFSYEKGRKQLEQLGLLEHTKETDGFTIYRSGMYCIFYNDDKSKCPPGRVRFTIAHELGHILLNHAMIPGENCAYSLVNREPEAQDDLIEQQANVFASRLLAPAGVLHELGADSPEKIAQYCGLSKQSATYRWERIKKLIGRNKFGTSPLEVQALKNFEEYITRMREENTKE